MKIKKVRGARFKKRGKILSKTMCRADGAGMESTARDACEDGIAERDPSLRGLRSGWRRVLQKQGPGCKGGISLPFGRRRGIKASKRRPPRSAAATKTRRMQTARDERELLAGAVEAEGARAEIGDQQSAAEHGKILEEIGHLHLAHHGIMDGPEIMHEESNGNEEENEEPNANFGFVAEENAECAEDAKDAGDGNGNGGHRDASACCVGAQSMGEVHGTKEQKSASKKDSSEQNDDFHLKSSTKGIGTPRARV